jgi:hypothetical protein
MTNEIKALAERVQRLEDVGAIHALKFRYLRACDRKQPDVVADCFVPRGAQIEYDRIGAFSNREDFVKVYTEMGCRDVIIDMHHGQNPVIDFESADRASGVWDIYYYGVDLENRTAIQVGGYYEDVYVRQDARWLIAASRFHNTSLMVHRIGPDGDMTAEVLGRLSA